MTAAHPDKLGQWASALCVVHCLAWPALFWILPAWLLSGAEPVLWGLMAVFIGWSCWKVSPWRSGAWVGFGLGIGLLVATHLLLPEGTRWHVPCAIIASLCLAYAHHRQLRQHRAGQCCAHRHDP